MICKSCGKENDDDAKYCKECGQRLAVASPGGSDDYLKVGELIYSAYRHSEAGRMDDAILACRGALALDPDNASAHALLGSLYERRGDIAMAIAEYERAVALNPANKADRQKLEDLKAGRVSIVKPRPIQIKELLEKLKPHAPVILASLVVFIVLAVGINIATRGRARQGSEVPRQSERQTQQASQPQTVYPGQWGAGVPAGPQQPAQQVPGQPVTPQGVGQMQRQNVEPGQAQHSQEDTARRTRPGVPSVPLPGAAQMREQQRVSEQTNQRQERPSGETPVIVPVQEPSIAQVPAPAPAPQPQVTVSQPRPSPLPSNPEDRAYELQRAGKYQEAIAAYTEALNQTTDPANVHQQIALCHQRLGDYAKAIEHYNIAIRSYREQLAAGRDQNEVMRKIRACEAGIEVSRTQARR